MRCQVYLSSGCPTASLSLIMQERIEIECFVLYRNVRSLMDTSQSFEMLTGKEQRLTNQYLGRTQYSLRERANICFLRFQVPSLAPCPRVIVFEEPELSIWT
ncbi:hypothetical protein DPMN_144902 [Dreissena polymorpha]|uniref:Uncharacterized protein n=1 Tax=Dreissena polymorpha TaxID=45954 RepID=A0A9D4F8V2_DREPO|nr:hypothetical protein DPMN_144902 [Dreissena polymorpha]